MSKGGRGQEEETKNLSSSRTIIISSWEKGTRSKEEGKSGGGDKRQSGEEIDLTSNRLARSFQERPGIRENLSTGQVEQARGGTTGSSQKKCPRGWERSEVGDDVRAKRKKKKVPRSCIRKRGIWTMLVVA